ncbi:MAG: transporter substrate-binding domain-containing protein [Gammaproteobacteria bacterium WSBS_2016_MAG_OTU1]
MKTITYLIIACLAALSAPTHAGVVEDAIDRGTLRVGLSSFVPWAMRSKTGEFIGFEPDVARQLAADMGVEIEIVATSWDGIIPALLAKKFDLIIGGMSVTPARNLQVNFSIPYAYTGLGLVANKARMGHATTPEEFNNEKIVFALRRGTTPVEAVKTAMPKAEIRQYDSEAAVIQELLNGRADAWVAGAPGHTDAARNYPDKLFLPFDELLNRDQAGIVIRKGDSDGLNFLNNWISVKMNEGWLQQRHDYWFKGNEWTPLVGGE